MLHSIPGAFQAVSRIASSAVSAPKGLLRGFALTFGTLVLLLTVPLAASAQRGVSISFLPDETASMTIEQAASKDNAARYREYVPSFMAFSRLPGSFNGAIWLRFALDSSFEKPVSALTLDLGASLPGVTRLYIPQTNGAFTVMNSRPPQSIFTLPEDAPLPDALYTRLDGVPDLWFRPHLGPADNGPRILPLHLFLGGLFAFAMLVQLIQYVRKAEEWRLWGAITAGCGIVTAILPPIPAAGAAFTPLMTTGMVMPGLTLLLFAHTARHLFDSPRTMPSYDKIMLLMYVLGAATALAPLAPGFLWVSRYLSFSGIFLLLLAPTAMAAMARSLKGCSVFFCACIITVAGVMASAWELTASGVPLVAGNGGLWGFALALTLLAFISPASPAHEAQQEEDVFDCLNRAASETALRNEDGDPTSESAASLPENEFAEPGAEPPSARDLPTPALDAEKDIHMPLSGGARPLMSETSPHQAGTTDEPVPSTAEEEEVAALSLFEDSRFAGQPSPPVESAPASPMPESPLLPIPDSALEERPQTVPPFVFPHDAGAPASPEPEQPEPAQTVRPESAPVIPDAERAEALETVATGVPPATAPAVSPVYLDDAASANAAGAPEASEHMPLIFTPRAVSEQSRKILFDLPLIVKNAYDALAPMAEEKNLGLSWFIAPQTGRLFEGEADLLESALRLLLRDMVEALGQGNVRLGVRRLPNSPEAGHLVFTVVEWDAKEASCGRNMAGLSEAWALAERTGGIFSVEHSPTSGTTVLFSAMFTPMDKPTSETGVPSISTEQAPAGTLRGASEPIPAKSSRIFTGYPDIAMPKEADDGLSVPAAPTLSGPTGVDMDELAMQRETGRANDRLIIADIAATNRAKTASAFTGTPYAVLECASPADAYNLYIRHPSALLIMNADMPEVDIIAAMKDIHADDETHGRPPALTIALVGYETQADRLLRAGCTRAVMKEAAGDELLTVVQELVPLKPADTQPAPAPEELPAPLPLEERVHAVLADIPSMESGTDASPRAGKTAAEPIVAGGLFDSLLPEPNQTAADAAPSAKPALSSGMGLLDMIITDEDDAEEIPAPRTQPWPEPAPKAASVLPPASAAGQDAVPSGSSMEVPAALSQPKRENARKGVRVLVKPSPAVQTPAPAPVRDPEPERKNNAAQTVSEPLHIGGTGSTSSGDEEYGDIPTPSISIPLPGEEDSVFKDMVPLIPGLIIEMTDAMEDAARGREEKSPLLVQEAAERIAGKAESFGLTRLERMARCVERAAAADDIEPMECVLSDLDAWVTRYKEVLQQLHRNAEW